MRETPLPLVELWENSTPIVQSYGKEAIREGYLVITSKECVNETNERLKK